ncbi:hypothetical protein GCM10025792_04910 [Pseudonocardia tropica]
MNDLFRDGRGRARSSTVGRNRSPAPRPWVAVRDGDPADSPNRTAAVPDEHRAAHPDRTLTAQVTGRFGT